MSDDHDDVDELLELPGPGEVVWARTLGMETSVRCRIEGRDTTVLFEHSMLKGSPFERRVHLVEEYERGDSIGWFPVIGRLRRCDAPDDAL